VLLTLFAVAFDKRTKQEHSLLTQMEVPMFPVAVKNIAEDIAEGLAAAAFLTAIIMFANAMTGGMPV
jgi:hypothetical protein